MSNQLTLSPALTEQQLELLLPLSSDGFTGVDRITWTDIAFLDRNGYRIVVFKTRLSTLDSSYVVEADKFELSNAVLIRFNNSVARGYETQMLLIMQPSDDVKPTDTAQNLYDIATAALGFEIPRSGILSRSRSASYMEDGTMLPYITLDRHADYTGIAATSAAGYWFSQAYIAEFLKPFGGTYFDGKVLFMDFMTSTAGGYPADIQEFIGKSTTLGATNLFDSGTLYFDKTTDVGAVLERYKTFADEHSTISGFISYDEILEMFSIYCFSNVVANVGHGAYIRSDNIYTLCIPAVCTYYLMGLVYPDEDLESMAEFALANFPETCAYLDGVYSELEAILDSEYPDSYLYFTLGSSAYDKHNSTDIENVYAIMSIYIDGAISEDADNFTGDVRDGSIVSSFSTAPTVLGSSWTLFGGGSGDDPEPGPDDTDNYTVAVTINGLKPYKAAKRVQVAVAVDFDELETNRGIRPWKFR